MLGSLKEFALVIILFGGIIGGAYMILIAPIVAEELAKVEDAPLFDDLPSLKETNDGLELEPFAVYETTMPADWQLPEDGSRWDISAFEYGTIAISYTVQVYTDHQAGASDNDAMRCLNNYGNNMGAYSEFGTFFLHLPCLDESTNTLYDIVVARIIKPGDAYKHRYTKLIRTERLGNPQGLTMSQIKERVLNWLKTNPVDPTKERGIVVRLEFKPGEVLFDPNPNYNIPLIP